MIYYINAFAIDTSYELRRTKPNDLKVSHTLAEELEKCRKSFGKSDISGFTRGHHKNESKGKGVKENEIDPIEELIKLIKTMKVNHSN